MSLIYVLGRYGASAITLVAISLYTRWASPAEYGFYALVMAFASALYASFGQWLRQVLLRFTVQCEVGAAPLPSAIFQTYLATAGLLACAIFAIGVFLDGAIADALAMTIPLLFTMGVFELTIAWLQLQLRSGFYVAMSLLRTLSAACFGLLALHFGYGATGLVLATSLAYLIGAVPVLWSTGFGLGPARGGFAAFRPMIKYGLPIAVSAAMGSALALADRAIITALISTEAAGLYAAPYDLANRTLQVLMLAINLAGMPLILRAYEDRNAVLTGRMILRLWLLLLMAGLPVTIAMISMPLGISRILLGSAFQEAGAQLMPLVAAATFLQGLETFYFGLAFALAKRPLRQTLVLLVATLVNIGCTFWFVPIMGIIGGAWATLISATVAIIGSALLGMPVQRLAFAPRSVIQLSFAGAVMAGFLFWHEPTTPIETIFSGLVGLLLYAAVLIGLDIGKIRRSIILFLRSRFLPASSAGETS